jgi:uncharacterized membrane protein
VIDNKRKLVGGLGRLRAFLPGLLFVVFVGAFVGVGAAARTRSLLLTLAGVVAVVATVAALAARTLIAERFGRDLRELPRHVAWHPHQWAEFEHAFWSYVDGS